MFIEHEFETDLASDDVLRRLVEILDQLGFRPIEAGPAMRFRRALREKSQLDLLNSNITAIARHSDRGVSIGIQLDTPGRVGEHHAALCRALAHLCESIIVRGQTLEDARREWDQRIAAF